MGACGAFQVARAEVHGGMLCVRACRRAPPAVCMPKRPRIRSARAGQRPAPRHHQGEGPTAISGRDSALARARSTVKCCQNPGQIKSETRSDKIRTGGQMDRNPQGSDGCGERGPSLSRGCGPCRPPPVPRKSHPSHLTRTSQTLERDCDCRWGFCVWFGDGRDCGRVAGSRRASAPALWRVDCLVLCLCCCWDGFG